MPAQITEVIPSLGTPPTTADPATFDTRADTLLGTALPAMITAENVFAAQANALSTEVNTKADEAAASSVSSAGFATASSASSGVALTHELNAASSANFKGAWASLTGALAKPASVSNNNKIYLLLNNLADVTLSEPGMTADWETFGALMIEERTSNTEITANDIGKIIQYTTGGFTQTFAAVSGFSANWFGYIKNASATDVTLNPNGAETIDGLTSFVMYPGEMRLVMINSAGTAFVTYVLNSFSKGFDASGTFNKPPGYQTFSGILWSAGSSGQRTNYTGTPSRGGAGGGAFPFDIPAASFGATETITIGAGGAVVTTVADGNAGGNSSIGSLLTVFGGSDFRFGGAIGISNAFKDSSGGQVASFAAGGVASGSSSTVWGGANAHIYGTSPSGSSVYGGAGGGGLTEAAVLAAAGTSLQGGDGGVASSVGNGVAGEQPAGGGGATHTGTQSGAGGDGRLVIRGVL